MSMAYENNIIKFANSLISSAKDGLSDGADKIVVESQAAAPVKTGELRQSIHKEVSSSGELVKVKASVPTGIPHDYAHWRHVDSSKPEYLSLPLWNNDEFVLQEIIRTIQTEVKI